MTFDGTHYTHACGCRVEILRQETVGGEVQYYAGQVDGTHCTERHWLGLEREFMGEVLAQLAVDIVTVNHGGKR